MLNLTRHLLVVFLVLLQFIAPLVHAHAGKQLPGLGIHLPGLEFYDLNHPDAFLAAAHEDVGMDAMFVGVNTGIERQFSIASDPTEIFGLIEPSVPIVSNDRLCLTINFSPQDILVPSYRPHDSISLRAPPVL